MLRRARYTDNVLGRKICFDNCKARSHAKRETAFQISRAFPLVRIPRSQIAKLWTAAFHAPHIVEAESHDFRRQRLDF